jgi:hypothetical protein
LAAVSWPPTSASKIDRTSGVQNTLPATSAWRCHLWSLLAQEDTHNLDLWNKD